MPIGLLVRHVDDDDARPVQKVVVQEALLDSDFSSGVSPAHPNAVAAPLMRLTINVASLEACGMGHADACPFAHTWAPDAVAAPLMRLVVNDAASIACASFADACVSAQTWVPVR